MFFIWISSIEQSQVPIGLYNNTICPCCGALTRFEILKSFSCLHLFFIPTFKFNVKYFVKTACCNKLYSLDKQIAEQYEKGLSPQIKLENLRKIEKNCSYNICPQCNSRIETDYIYCPYCGKEL
jgi:predicted amidophosphoribosyltransferase